MRFAGAATVLSLMVAGCSDDAGPRANEPVKAEMDQSLPRFEHVAVAAENKFGRCSPDCAGPAPFLGISRVVCRPLSPFDAECSFFAFRRSLDLGLVDSGFDAIEGGRQRCSVTMRKRYGEHDAFWEDAVTDPLRRRATSMVRCSALGG